MVWNIWPADQIWHIEPYYLAHGLLDQPHTLATSPHAACSTWAWPGATYFTYPTGLALHAGSKAYLDQVMPKPAHRAGLTEHYIQDAPHASPLCSTCHMQHTQLAAQARLRAECNTRKLQSVLPAVPASAHIPQAVHTLHVNPVGHIHSESQTGMCYAWAGPSAAGTEQWPSPSPTQRTS